MTSLLRLLRSLGPAGAVANVAAQREARRHEDFVVRSVERRVARAAGAAAGAAAVATAA